MVFVLLDNVKSFDMSNEKTTEGQIRERKIHVYTWTPWTENHARTTPERSITHMIWFLIMECCWSLLTHNKTFFLMFWRWINH